MKQQARRDIGIVIIGKNEGERLIACLKSVLKSVHGQSSIVYVDSGSTDGSVEAAKQLGAEVVALTVSKAEPFTAARARNAGIDRLREIGAPQLVQFIDGDCELAPGWFEKAQAHLSAYPDVAVVCGRRREKFPEATLFNKLTDREWDTPIGEAEACGGDALMRWRALEDVGGYNSSLIAGEEPELCLRLRANGWIIYRLDEEMTAHDIAMTHIGQWLKRARRAGHAFAEVSTLYKDKPECIWAAETRRAFLWSAIMGIGLIGGLLHPPIFLGIALLVGAQITRVALRDDPATKESFQYSALLMVQKLWEAVGAAQYFMGGSRPIEYKKKNQSEGSP